MKTSLATIRARLLLFAAASVTATVLVAVGGVIAWQIQTAPELNPTRIVESEDAAARNPGVPIARVLDRVSGALTTAKLTEMNRQVEFERRTPREVARDFLRREDLAR